MTFHDVRLPVNIERGARGGPRFKTTVLALGTGFEKRNIDWQYARHQWNVGYGVQDKTSFQQIMEFFRARRGRAYGFRFKDWGDFQIGRSTPQFIIAGDGSTTQVQMFKRYTDSGGTYDHPITKPVSGTVVVYEGDTSTVLSDSNYTVDYSTGVITKTGGTGGAAFQNSTNYYLECEFDYPVRFDEDVAILDLEWENAGAVPPIEIIELRQDLTVI